MKKLFFFLCLFGLITLAVSCSGSKGATTTRSINKEFPYENFNNLADVLRQQGGLQVTGQGDNASVYIRGISTIQLDTQPLYVINGTPIGTSYAAANNAVNVKDITSVRVLRSKSETTIYGEPGNNGVILIKTKAMGNN